MTNPRSRRSPALAAGLAVAAAAAVAGAAAWADGKAAAPPAGGDAPGGPAGVFFRDPDPKTAQRIEDDIAQFQADAVPTRRKARADLESLGYWSVDPLIAAVRKQESPIKCSAVLTLDAIGDRRALEPLRDAVVREDSNAYVGAFAALALGRLHDGPATAAFRKALDHPRELDLLRAAVPLALAKLRTPDALTLLREQVAASGASEPVTSARLLAVGFFPEAALAPGGDRPGPALAAGMGSRQRRGERQAALLGFLVATARSRQGRDYLLEVADSETAPEVVSVALIGLATFGDADVTERLARVVTSGASDRVRELACDLLIPRGDESALPALLRVVKAQSSAARLRASAVLAIGRIDSPEACDAIIDRLHDGASLVRAAAAVAAARSSSEPLRTRALAIIDARLKGGETDPRTKEVLRTARSVLTGERQDVVWPEAGVDPLFATMDLTPRRRLLDAVNRRAEKSLDLEKIGNLQTDQEMTPHDTPSLIPGLDGGPGGPDTGGAKGDESPVPGGGPPSAPAVGSVGAARTSVWQELRDLKYELWLRPYFGEDDLPAPPAAATGEAPK